MKPFIRRMIAKKQMKKRINEMKKKQISDNLSEVDEEEISNPMLGKLFNDKYMVLKFLGHGTFSTVWLVYDIYEDRYLALKMYKPEYEDDAKDEIKHLKLVSGRDGIIKMIDNFDCYHNDLKHTCLLTEVLGKNLLTLYNMFDNGIDMKLFKKIAYQILTGLNSIHSQNVIHCDLKMENMMLSQLTGEVKETIDWFKSTNPQKLLDILITKELPENWSSIQPQKRKKMSKKIKLSCAKKLSQKYKPEINKKVNELGELRVDLDTERPKQNSTELGETLNLDDESMPEIVDFNKRNTIKTSQTNSEDKLTLPDDEMDIDINNIDIKLCDFGNSQVADELTEDEIQIRSYRAPEVILGEYYNEKTDIWTLGCILYEFLTKEQLFTVNSEQDENTFEDSSILYQMHKILGKMPTEYVEDTERGEDLFTQQGKVKQRKEVEWNFILNELREIIDNNDELTAIMRIIKNKANNQGSFEERLKNEFPNITENEEKYELLLNLGKNGYNWERLEEKLVSKRPDLSVNQLNMVSKFLRQMLECLPNKRSSANDLLKSDLFDINRLAKDLSLEDEYNEILAPFKNNQTNNDEEEYIDNIDLSHLNDLTKN